MKRRPAWYRIFRISALAANLPRSHLFELLENALRSKGYSLEQAKTDERGQIQLIPETGTPNKLILIGMHLEQPKGLQIEDLNLYQ